jgi:hypothetical protein
VTLFAAGSLRVVMAAGGGAMAGVRIGWVMSSARALVGGADAVRTGGRHAPARKLLDSLVREFPDNDDVRQKLDIVRWRLRNRLVAPAEAASRDISRKPCRDDPEASSASPRYTPRDWPDDLARRVFGLWSNACFSVVEQRGWLEPRREAPITRSIRLLRAADRRTPPW